MMEATFFGQLIKETPYLPAPHSLFISILIHLLSLASNLVHLRLALPQPANPPNHGPNLLEFKRLNRPHSYKS